MTVRFLAEAEAELDEAFAYYDTQISGLGSRFMTEVAEAVALIRDHQKAWTKLGRRTRRCQLKRFPYGLIYSELPDEIVVIAVMHLHRRPAYWKGRLRGL